MKITGNQWVEITRAISTAIIAIITTLCVQSCTMSLSVAKNNNNASQKPNKRRHQASTVQKLILILKNKENGKFSRSIYCKTSKSR